MMEQVIPSAWVMKDEEVKNPTGKMIVGGIIGMLIGIILVFSFSGFLLKNFGGWWGIYGIAFGFVVLGGIFGRLAGGDDSEKLYKKKDVNYWRS
jgi:hypothetical protein